MSARDEAARRALADRVRQATEEAVASVASWPRGRDAPDELAAAVSAVVLASDLRAPAPHVAPQATDRSRLQRVERLLLEGMDDAGTSTLPYHRMRDALAEVRAMLSPTDELRAAQQAQLDQAGETREADVPPPSSSYATGPDAALPPPSGEVDGWRWWVVDDGEESWLAYDNRPQLEEWDARFVTIAMQQHVSRRPALVQGKVPMPVVRAAVGS